MWCTSLHWHHIWSLPEGRLDIDLDPPSIDDIEQELPDLDAGGHWSPSDCIPRQRLALIIPYKDRATHLHVFLNHYHRMLQRQKIEYRIFVSEQVRIVLGELYNLVVLLLQIKIGKFLNDLNHSVLLLQIGECHCLFAYEYKYYHFCALDFNPSYVSLYKTIVRIASYGHGLILFVL